ncbi:uncharacterized protein LOC133724663 [Rosa rugosa]|uniref:uncharacterized protein LOC133724663 n=1 Tax=Rosa rugosa TaxID=74645 RepID=UPI002B40153C|nr:uncharacterized protein LOC133724663 [Rosa rugosa]
MIACYAQVSLEACYEIQEVIETYGRASGQFVNFNKSSVVFNGNVSEALKDEVSELLGVEVVASHEKYLGLPTYVGRKKTATFLYIKDNLAKKLEAWQGKMFSRAGKDILIRVVAQALPSYAMSVFQLTKNFCDDLEQMCARFWWGSTLDKKKIHWKTWKALCNPKEEGGLGFRSLSNFNSAMLAKQAWRVINNPSSLIARSYWQVGGGTSVNIWSTAWVSELPGGKPVSNSLAMEEVTMVGELLSSTGVWNEGLIRRLFPSEEAEAILRIPLSLRVVSDRLIWKLERNGQFSVRLSLNDLGELFCWLWSIWRERNSQAWEDKTSRACDVIIKSVSRLEEFRFHNSKPQNNSTRRGRVATWAAPPVAEHGLSPAILETDALEVQRQLSSPSITNTSALGHLYEDLSFMLEDLGNVRMVYIGRKANMVAHLLAAHGNDLVHDTFYFSTPSFLMAAVAADFSSL